MKVLHIISGDLWAGAEMQAFTLLSTLQKHSDVEVAAVLMNEGELSRRLREKNILVEVLPENKMSAPAIVSGLVRFIKAWKPDVIHTHRIKENILGSVANLLSINAPAVRTVHGAAEHIPKSLFQLHKHALNNLNRCIGALLQKKIIAVSQELATKLAKEFPQNKIVVIENGIDRDIVRSQVHAVDFKSLHSNTIHIGIVGRLVPVKRVDIFLEAAALLQSRNPDRKIQFHIFGDGPLTPTLTKQAEQLGLNRTTTFHGHRNDTVACIANLDLLIMCSDHEGLPMTLLEALAVGTKIIAHGVGGIPALLTSAPNAWIVEQNTPDAYCAAAIMALEANRSDLMWEDSADYRERYSAHALGNRHVQLYTSVLKR